MTAFQEKVYKALSLIPKGSVTTYGDIARFLKTRAVQAVGSAVGKNPNAPEVPCHRVVPYTGRVGNYSAGDGVITKMALLKAEGVSIDAGKIVNFEKIRFKFKGSINDA